VYSTGIAVTIQLGSIDCLRLTASYDHEIVSSIATRPIQARIVAARRAAKSLAVTLITARLPKNYRLNETARENISFGATGMAEAEGMEMLVS